MMFAKKTRVSSGVEQLDKLLGGLFIGDNVVWYDDAGSLAAVFSHSFIAESQSRAKPLIYVSFDRSPKTILGNLGQLAESQYLTILDCFTYGKGDGSDLFSKFFEKNGARWPYQIVQVKEPWKPDQLAESIYSLHGTMTGDVRFVFESLTGMQDLWGGEETILKFYSRSCPRLYELETIAYWIMEKGAHSDRLKARINQIAQVAIDLSIKRGKSALRILKADKRKPDNLNVPVHYWDDGASVYFESEKRQFSQIDLGSRIKHLRTGRELSQKDLAGLIGVTPSTISQIESNTIYPSLPALAKIAQILNVEMGWFFKGKKEPDQRIVFSGPGTRIGFQDLPKQRLERYRLVPEDLEAKADPFLIEIPPDSVLKTHFFAHKGDEVGYVLAGQLQVTVNDQVHDLKAGDRVYLSANMPSQWKSIGPEPARLLWLTIK